VLFRSDRQKKIYCKEFLYSTNLDTSDIISINKEYIKPDDLLIADSAEPRLIKEMRDKGINVQPAKKGPDSVKKGIMDMQGYTIVVDPSSSNLIKELNNYIWNDKKSSTPHKGFDHLIDPIRYVYQHLNERPVVIFR